MVSAVKVVLYFVIHIYVVIGLCLKMVEHTKDLSREDSRCLKECKIALTSLLVAKCMKQSRDSHVYGRGFKSNNSVLQQVRESYNSLRNVNIQSS